MLSDKGVSTNVDSVAGHANLAQNELADKAAKSAADSAAYNAESHVSLSTLKSLTRRNTGIQISTPSPCRIQANKGFVRTLQTQQPHAQAWSN